MATSMSILGILGAIFAGILVGLFAPFAVTTILIIIALVVALMPQFPAVRQPAILFVLAAILTNLVMVYAMVKFA